MSDVPEKVTQTVEVWICPMCSEHGEPTEMTTKSGADCFGHHDPVCYHDFDQGEHGPMVFAVEVPHVLRRAVLCPEGADDQVAVFLSADEVRKLGEHRGISEATPCLCGAIQPCHACPVRDSANAKFREAAAGLISEGDDTDGE